MKSADAKRFFETMLLAFGAMDVKDIQWSHDPCYFCARPRQETAHLVRHGGRCCVDCCLDLFS